MRKFLTIFLLFALVIPLLLMNSSSAHAEDFPTSVESKKKPKAEPTPMPKPKPSPGPRDGGADG